MPLLSQSLQVAFPHRPDLQQRILETTTKAPDLEDLFRNIASYVCSIHRAVGDVPASYPEGEEIKSKKRKLDHQPATTVGWDRNPQWSLTDVSFSVPQRKKFTLEVSHGSGIRATSLAGGTESVEVLVNWDNVRDVFCLPIPEKAQRQYNFCVFSEGATSDQVLWTVPDTAIKEGTYKGARTVQESDTYKTVLITEINKALKPHKKHVVEPSQDEFASQITQPHRKGERAFHIKAFRGSKDGYLFLLPTGILWGFKKPLEFFAYDSIETVSYTSVLQRTFNLNITTCTTTSSTNNPPTNTTQEFEFSMIDQADFAGIDAYIKRHRLQDASMAEQRRAKKVNVNGVKGKEGTREDGDEDGEGELEKARREAEDLEDEEEEDENFDPGSEGESEGSGSSSEEDDHGGGDDRREGDLVEEELGSEAESAEE